MRYRRPLEVKRGRMFAQLQLGTLNLPRLYVMADGDECVIVGFSYGTEGCDPVLLIDVTLSGTRLARPVANAYWLVRKRLGR